MYIRTIDIAHPPLSSEAAEQLLDDEAQNVRNAEGYRVIKIVHGHGTFARPGVLKQTVGNWAYRNRSRIRGVIPGEEYRITDSLTQEMRKECGQIADADLDTANPGITMIWIR